MKCFFRKISVSLLPLRLIAQSCSVTLSGASIPPEMKTVSIQFFENNAPLVVPYLSQQFTEALKERVRNQSRLSMIRSDAHGNFEGRITDYSIKPVAVEGTTKPRAGLNRLTISINVKYTNTLKPELSFEQLFSRYWDFDLNSGSLQAQEPELIRKVNNMLTEDIFNRAFANW